MTLTDPEINPDDDLDARLHALETEEAEVSRRRRRLHERLARFPSEHGDEQERALSARRRELHRQIDELYVERNRLRDGRDTAA